MPKAIGALKKDAEGKLETTAVLNGGTATIGAISNTSFDQGNISDARRHMMGYDYISSLRYVKVATDGRLKTLSALEAGSEVIGDVNRVATIGRVDSLGSIGNTSFNQGAVSDHGRWMQGLDYPSTLRYVRVNSEGKLETVGIIESGTIGEVGRVGTVGNISDIGRIGTIGDIEHLGSVANTSFDQGSVSDHKREMYMRQLGTWIPVEGEDENLKTVSVLQHGTASIGDINTVATVGHVDSLGSIANVSEVSRVGTVGDIEHLGSIANTKFNQGSLDDHDRWIKGDDVGTKRYVKVDGDGKLQTVGVLEAGTSVIGNLDHVATVGRIDRLGSIGNVSFDQGSVTDHRRRMYINEYGTWVPLQGTYGSPYVVPLMDRSGVLIPFDSSPNAELRVAIGYNGSAFTTIRLDASNRLQHAPATTRKGGKKLVTNMGTAVALVGPSTPCISVIVKALHTNAGEVYVGDNTVGSATGYILQKDEFVSLSTDDVNGVYIDRNAGTQGVSFLYVNY